MKHTILTIGDTDYKLRLTTQYAVSLQEKLKKPVLDALSTLEKLDVETMALLLWASGQKLNHGFSLNKAYDVIDEFYDEGNTIEDFISVIFEVLKVSGFLKEIPKEEKKQEEETEVL